MHSDAESSVYNKSPTLAICPLCSGDECRFPSTCQGDPWKFLMTLVQKSDRNMYKHKKEDLDHYFHYGIMMFTCNAAVLLDSYKWVTNNASYSAIAHLCRHHEDDDKFIPYDAAALIVALWAVSFILTSASLLMCRLSHQWLREFVNQPQFSHKNQLAFRQIHYDSLRRWGFFEICDFVPLLQPLAMLLLIAGLIVFLWQLNHPDASVLLAVSCCLFAYYLFVALHPFFCFLFTRQNGLTSELSPFRSPSSWFFFRLGNWLVPMNRFRPISYWKQRRKDLRQQSPKGLLPLYWPRLKQPIRTKSINWLEQDCSLFMDADNGQDVNISLTDALIWVDSNPTIEKTTKVVVSIYHSISSLRMSNVLLRFNESRTRSVSDLTEIIARASRRGIVNEPEATVFVLKSWLEFHIKRLPELRTQLAELQLHCMNAAGRKIDYARLEFNSFSAFLQQDSRLPIKLVHSLLTTAKLGLANNIYYEGTFKLIRQVLVQFQDSKSELRRQVDLVFAIFTECKRFAHSHQRSGFDEQQTRQFLSELQDFLRDASAISSDCDSTSSHHSFYPPAHNSDTWNTIISIANKVHDCVVIHSLPARQPACPASLTESVESAERECPHDGTSPAPTPASFDKTSNTDEKSAVTAPLGTWSAGDAVLMFQFTTYRSLPHSPLSNTRDESSHAHSIHFVKFRLFPG